MYIVTIISTLLITHSVQQTKCIRISNGRFEVRGENLPSRMYLPGFGNTNVVNNHFASGSDMKTVLENDLRVVPLAVDHDRRNGFQYQPIISQQYSRVSAEYPRYSQSVVPKLPHDPRSGNTRIVVESPISNGQNELKPIRNSLQLSLENNVAYPGENHPGLHRQFVSWCTGRFQSHSNGGGREGLSDGPSFETLSKLPRQKILTVNDQESNTGQKKLRLQLTPPSPFKVDDIIPAGIPRYSHNIDKESEHFFPKLTTSITGDSNRSKGMILIGHPGNRGGNDPRDVKPVFESEMEYEADYKDDYNKVRNNYNEQDYQLGNRDTKARTADSLQRYPLLSSKSIAPFTSGDTPLPTTIPSRANQRCNYLKQNFTTGQRIPTNSILALTLSQHGIYLPRGREPRVYAHLAVNNIHNNKPFGSYKLTGEKEEEEDEKEEEKKGATLA